VHHRPIADTCSHQNQNARTRLIAESFSERQESLRVTPWSPLPPLNNASASSVRSCKLTDILAFCHREKRSFEPSYPALPTRQSCATECRWRPVCHRYESPRHRVGGLRSRPVGRPIRRESTHQPRQTPRMVQPSHQLAIFSRSGQTGRRFRHWSLPSTKRKRHSRRPHAIARLIALFVRVRKRLNTTAPPAHAKNRTVDGSGTAVTEKEPGVKIN